MSSRRLVKALSRPPKELALLVEAAAGLLMARFIIGVFPFRFAVRFYRLRPGVTACVLTPGRAAQADRIGWTVRVAAGQVPWTTTCLMQSLVGAVLLRRRGLASTVHLGVARTKERHELEAHSWLICGDETLTGASGRERYASVGTYAVGSP